jgi:putative membrane protein
MSIVKKYWAEFLFIFLTAVGLLLLAIIGTDIIRITPMYIILNLGILFYRLGLSKKILSMFLVAALIGYIAEFIGVKTGILFGDYVYGSVLLVEFSGVPLLIGFMWGLVMLCIWMVIPVMKIGWRSIPLAGALAVLYDFPLEHFATRFDLWGWGGSIPVSNAVGWFFIASIIATVFYKNNRILHPLPIAYVTIISHLCFFSFALVLN